MTDMSPEPADTVKTGIGVNRTVFWVPTIDDTRWMSRRYILALTLIAILACSGFAAFQSLLNQHTNVLDVVNMSGRQRMLSQRTALFVDRLAKAESVEQRTEDHDALAAAVDLFEQSHRMLTGRSPDGASRADLSPAVQRLYFDGPEPLDRLVSDYVAALRRILDQATAGLNASDADIRFVLATAPGPLLKRLDRMVTQYQVEGEAALKRLEKLEIGVLCLTLLTLLIEATLIFAPMVRLVSRQISQITEISDALRRARDGLEETVRERTAELSIAKDEAEQAAIAKARFLAAASHDLRQPLDAIGMFAGLLERRATNDQSRQIIGDMRRAQRSMRHLLDTILDMSKLEARVVKVNERDFSASEVLSALTAELTLAADEKGLRLTVLPSSTPLRTDPDLLERILRNLAGNALTYTPAGGRVVIGCRRRKDGLAIQVHDSGPGIAASDIPLIFQEFKQLETASRDRGEGLGLGLAIVKRNADLLGLQLNVKSRLGKGSCFEVLIPAK
ncbi:MAG: ATP-binding protein [Rhodospirillales bacterium]